MGTAVTFIQDWSITAKKASWTRLWNVIWVLNHGVYKPYLSILWCDALTSSATLNILSFKDSPVSRYMANEQPMANCGSTTTD
jgi:hypothetical protein